MRPLATTALAILLASLPGVAAAEAPDGVWRLHDIRTTGIHAGTEAVSDDLGGELVIRDGAATLPDSTRCTITAEMPVRLRDDRQTFGTGGGSWRHLGLIASASGEYDAIEYGFDCDSAYLGMLVQPAHDVRLLVAYDGIYVGLMRVPAAGR